ncbi:MAG: protein kinase [Acidobacteria bacterium]|nr:protein kinase [Acidobacteriota bacterium]
MNFASLIGQVVDGKYKIESQLGKGGMGTVYLATHLGTERPVAVKVIVQQYMEREEFVERFRREARAAGRLRHPNVVDVTDFGIAEMGSGKTAYLVMEYLDGCTLGEILDEEKQLPLSWSLDIIEQVCSAIHEAHGQGIIHRDLKPDNIWLEPNQRGGYTVKVLDFGIAKLEEHDSELPDPGITFSGLPTEEIGPAATLADRSETVAGAGGTLVSESKTLIVRPEPGTIARESEDEKGTAIMTPIEDAGEDRTALFDSKGTKILSEAGSEQASGDSDPGHTAPRSAGLTRVGAVLGTPLYMSPEQCRGERLSPRSDIYSLGVITYQMLSGRTPFEGDFTSVMSAHKEIPPPPLEARKIPRKVRKVVHSALSKSPDERPQDAQAFAARLQASSEGIGALLNRAMTIFSERLTTFLAIGILVSIPALLIGSIRGGFKFAVGVEWIKESALTTLGIGVMELLAFLLQIFTAAILVGVITWVVAQILAVPLRPIVLRTAFAKVRQRLRPLVLTVTASTFLALVGWIVALIPAGIAGGVFGVPVYYLIGQSAGFIVGGAVSGIVWLFVGVGASALLMLVAPSIMMEGITGRAAFRRSIRLVRRSFSTVFAAALLNYVVPVLLGALIGAVISGLFKLEAKNESVAPGAPVSEKREDGLNVRLSGPVVDGAANEVAADDPDRNAKMMRRSLATGIFELLWAPITVLISTITSIITALIYFKTRQAGGESMQDLLEQFEETEQPKPKWQQRVQDRLIQSGRITSKP